MLTTKQAAEKLNVHPHTLRAWTDSGRVVCSRTAGGHRRFDPVGLTEGHVLFASTAQLLVGTHDSRYAGHRFVDASAPNAVLRLTQISAEPSTLKVVLEDPRLLQAQISTELLAALLAEHGGRLVVLDPAPHLCHPLGDTGSLLHADQSLEVEQFVRAISDT